MRFETPLGLFSIIWALAAVLHHLEAQPLAGLPLYPFAVLLFLYPDRIWAVATFALVHAALLSIDLPAAANHSVVALLTDVCLLVGCVNALRCNDAHARGRQLWESVQGPLRATLVIVYFCAIFHKLNSSFVDAEVSCATSLAATMFRLHGFLDLRTEASAFAPTIPLTLVAESAILIFLPWPRFARIGAVTGLLFHTVLGWAQFFDFSTVAFALYLFFFPWEDIQWKITRIQEWARTSFIASFIALAVTSFYFYGLRGNPVILARPEWSFLADSVICALWTLMVWPILFPIFSDSGQSPGARAWTGALLAWLIPLIALMNGATPYLGLKTVANYSMFSNLRTEGGQTNHWLIPAGQFFLARYQDDLARIEFVGRTAPERLPLWVRLAGGERWVRRNSRWVSDLPEARVPFVEVRRTLQLWRDIGFSSVSIGYERSGKRHTTLDATRDPELMRPLTFWERKLLAFRAVQDDGEESECRW